MSAITPSQLRDVNLVVIRGHDSVHLDDVTTSAEGLALLDKLDDAINSIEAQIDGSNRPDPSWLVRAEIALKRKQRSRSRLQQRINELRRTEQQIPAGVKLNRSRPEAQEKRIAFIDAAEAMLDRDLFIEIWERAKELHPAAFEGGRA